MTTSIRPLSEAVRSSLRSGIFLFDLTRVVEELVFNSLDAGATKVSVFVNVGSCYTKVVDDGAGISRDELVLVGERYATSKLLNMADLDATSGNFGFRGEALASISEVSLLEILTRACGRANGYHKVLKGCKCLYLGIDDDRKEVGTTVIVRDLFYNQPVRRKYIQSSQKKVLQSVKKCLLRLALVRPNILFKLVDIESEDELLCTNSSSSPLSLLSSGFGVEVSSSLHELQVQNDIIKLSGYISGPCNSFSLKALQYVYINSQFVCKGPIHKLLSELAMRFEDPDSWCADGKFQNKKRSRSQACPVYILNLSCPRSLYDLTFEPSKTFVQFKDWACILSFIEKAIKQIWEKHSTCGESSKYGAHVVQEDQLCEKVDNAISAEEDMFTNENQNRKDCHDFLFSTSDKLAEDDHHLSTKEDTRSSISYLHRGTAKFKGKQNKRGFLCPADYSSSSMDGSRTKCESTVTKKHNSLLMYDNNDLFERDYVLDSELPAAEIFNNDVSFDAPSSSNGIKFLKVADVFSGSSEDTLRYNDTLINGDFQKPFLRSCSIQGSILHERALFANDEREFHTDSFSARQDLGEYRGSGEDIAAHPSPEGLFNSSVDSVLLSTTQMELYPIIETPLSEAVAWDVDQKKDIDLDDLQGITKYYKRDHYIKILDDEENKWDFSCNISCSSNKDQFTTNLGKIELCFDGPCDRNRLNFTKSSDSRLVDWPDCDDIFSKPDCDDIFFNKWSDVSTHESDWLHPESCEKNKRLSKSAAKRDHLRHPALDKKIERSRRSSSAPPFYRGKRRFYTLNQPTEIISKRRSGSNCALNDRELAEAVEAERVQESFGTPQSNSEEHFLLENSSNTKLRTDVVGDIEQVICSKEFEGLPSFNSQSNVPLKELFSREEEDSIDYRTKWRNCSPQIPKRGKSFDFQNQDKILDISSGFLHLASDSLVPETFSKKCLEDARVLHQVDKKFIPVVAGRILAVIDQHAADERIRLEELRQKVLSGEAKSINYLDAEQELVLPEIGYQLLYSYSEQIKDWGWICNIHSQDSKSFKQNLDILNRQPAVITLTAVPCILGVNLNDVDLMEFLQQLADTDGSSTMPPAVVRVLNLKACRGAIMFGDSLLPSECSLIVEELKQTSLCFQCAHGRPTTVPLVNLEALHNQIAKLGLINDFSPDDDKWHGLQRHKISVARAAQRLCSAGE